MWKKSRYALLACVLAGLMSGCGTQNQQTEQTTQAADSDAGVVSTTFGKVSGLTEGEQITYYGIPYGKNPVDTLRWSAPQDPDAWDDVLDCTQKEEIALQMQTTYDESGTPSTAMAGTSDCLNLDVYTKKDSEKLPVIVYIHGGNNQTGSSFEIGGQDLVANQDVVYVSVNYRLGLLGFNCLPAVLDDGESGNFGLLDIKKSLEWVENNIEQFGGDPDNITISGFSAGGRDVMATLISPEFEGLYDKAVVYSGGMTVANLSDSQKKIAEIMAPLAVEDGKCATEEEAAAWLLEDTQEVTDYLMRLPEDRIIGLLSDAGIRMSKFPHLYGDDITLPSSGFENAKYVQDVPVIMLTGTDEFSMFTAFDTIYSEFGDQADAAKAFAIRYGSDFYRIFNTQLSAEKMAASYQSPMYLCQVQYGGENSQQKIDTLGSFHGIFVPMLTNTHGYTSFYDFQNPAYQNMAKSFVQYLVNFASTGDPNGDGLETWKPWTMQDKSTMLFDGTDEGAVVKCENVYCTNDEIINELKADTSITENVKARVIGEILNGRWFSADLDAAFGSNTGW